MPSSGDLVPTNLHQLVSYQWLWRLVMYICVCFLVFSHIEFLISNFSLCILSKSQLSDLAGPQSKSNLVQTIYVHSWMYPAVETLKWKVNFEILWIQCCSLRNICVLNQKNTRFFYWIFDKIEMTKVGICILIYLILLEMRMSGTLPQIMSKGKSYPGWRLDLQSL